MAMVVKTGQDCLRLHMLNMMNKTSVSRPRLEFCVYNDRWLKNTLKDRYQYNPTPDDVLKVLEGLLSDGLAEIVQYHCDCCKLANHEPEEILKHAVRLGITQKGHDFLPEHIFP